MEILIRTAELTDSEAVTELSGQLGYKTSNEKMLERLPVILSNPDNCIFVAVNDKKVIAWIGGFYSVRIESDPFAEIGGLVVDKDHRGKGIGKMLVEKVVEWSRLKKIDRIRVRCNTVRKDTHQFYNRLGFTEVKEQKIFDLRLD